MALANVKFFEHDGKKLTIQSNGSMVEVRNQEDESDLVMIVDHNSNIHTFEGRYGHLSKFNGIFEFFKAPISTRVVTGCAEYIDAIEFVTRHYLDSEKRALVESCGGETD